MKWRCVDDRRTTQVFLFELHSRHVRCNLSLLSNNDGNKVIRRFVEAYWLGIEAQNWQHFAIALFRCFSKILIFCCFFCFSNWSFFSGPDAARRSFIKRVLRPVVFQPPFFFIGMRNWESQRKDRERERGKGVCFNKEAGFFFSFLRFESLSKRAPSPNPSDTPNENVPPGPCLPSFFSCSSLGLSLFTSSKLDISSFHTRIYTVFVALSLSLHFGELVTASSSIQRATENPNSEVLIFVIKKLFLNCYYEFPCNFYFTLRERYEKVGEERSEEEGEPARQTERERRVPKFHSNSSKSIKEWSLSLPSPRYGEKTARI